MINCILYIYIVYEHIDVFNICSFYFKQNLKHTTYFSFPCYILESNQLPIAGILLIKNTPTYGNTIIL
jgi:hypothetical protein